jgi:hypothetical protein
MRRGRSEAGLGALGRGQYELGLEAAAERRLRETFAEIAPVI